MRIPKSEFTDSDLKLCRAHGDAVKQDHYSRMLVVEVVREPEFKRSGRAVLPADLPLPPSYWDDLEHWLKTLAPAKPAAPNAGMNQHHAAIYAELAGATQPEPAADVWHSEAPSVAGVYIASAFRDGNRLRWFDGREWHQDVSRNASAAEARCSVVESTSYQSRVQWIRLIEADAPAQEKPAKLTHSVCIKAYACFHVGEVRPWTQDEATHGCWINSDKDGWIPHTPTADSVCPVPDGVEYEALRRSGTVTLFGGVPDNAWQIGFKYDRSPGPGDVVALRPIAKDAS